MKIYLQRTTVALLIAVGAIAASRPSAAALSPSQSTTSSAAASSSSGGALVPFKIHVEDAVLADLKDRLTRARFPDELTGAGWTYGMNLGYLKELVMYWHDRFDWRAQERRLNAFDQFKTNIDGLDIHFIHQRSHNPNAAASEWVAKLDRRVQQSDWSAHRSCQLWRTRRRRVPRRYSFDARLRLFRKATRAGLRDRAHRR